MKKKYSFIIISLIILIDQILKKLVVKFLKLRETRNLFGKVIKLYYVTNTGGAFSLRRKYKTYNNVPKYYTYALLNLLFSKTI